MKAGREDLTTGRKGKLAPNLPVITLLSDFGTADYYVGAMRGAILSVNPRAAIFDLTHEIPPQDVADGAFILLAVYTTFPAGTIHVAVVDPGVGSTRRPIIVSAGGQFFVGPDNGLFTYLYDRDPAHQVFHVTAKKYFRSEMSTTFHGRDIFAPVAAAVSNGVKLREFGPVIDDAVRLPVSLEPEVLGNGDVRARILHCDHFGNCVTNITREMVASEQGAKLVVNRKTVRQFRSFYGDESTKAPFAIWGSAGYLEISVNGGSAAKTLGARRDDEVMLKQRPNNAK